MISEKLHMIGNEIKTKNQISQHVLCEVSRSINMNTFVQALSTKRSVGFNISSSVVNVKEEDSSRQVETMPVVAQVLDTATTVDNNLIHDVTKFLAGSPDNDNVDDDMQNIKVKSHAIKRKYGEIQSHQTKHDTSSHSLEPIKKLLIDLVSPVIIE